MTERGSHKGNCSEDEPNVFNCTSPNLPSGGRRDHQRQWASPTRPAGQEGTSYARYEASGDSAGRTDDGSTAVPSTKHWGGSPKGDGLVDKVPVTSYDSSSYSSLAYVIALTLEPSTGIFPDGD